MKQVLQIAIDYMNDRLEDHDCKYQRHPATEAERINILADIETVKEALASEQEQRNVSEQLGEPVAWQVNGSMVVREDWIERLHWPFEYVAIGRAIPDGWVPVLYTTPYVPTGRQPVTESHKRKPLTDEQILEANTFKCGKVTCVHVQVDGEPENIIGLARAIEAAHGITKENT